MKARYQRSCTSTRWSSFPRRVKVALIEDSDVNVVNLEKFCPDIAEHQLTTVTVFSVGEAASNGSE